ncbi:hypothetical protein L1887_09155 [Cichorium endivia]|nr:hypothetical protein L1887_09155 [Cichorium endivia]
MTTPTRMTLQMDPFHNCEGCIRKVKKTLFELGNVFIVAIYPNKGEVTIITGHSLEVIECALKHIFPKNDISQLQEAGHQDPPSPQCAFDLGNMARSLTIASDIEGLNFSDCENQPSSSTSASTRPQPSTADIEKSNNYSKIIRIEELDD